MNNQGLGELSKSVNYTFRICSCPVSVCIKTAKILNCNKNSTVPARKEAIKALQNKKKKTYVHAGRLKIFLPKPGDRGGRKDWLTRKL